MEGGGYDGDVREVDMSDGQIIDTVIASARQTVIKNRAVRAMEIATMIAIMVPKRIPVLQQRVFA